MKKIFSNNRLIAIAFLTMFSVGAASSVSASDKTPLVPVTLRFTGHVNKLPVFELSFRGNAQQDNFTIFINDEFDNELYRENIKGEVFTKKFALNTEELGDKTIRFEIYCNNTKKSARFEVNRNSKTIQEVEVLVIK